MNEPTRPALNALVIDDERNIRRTVRIVLETHGCRVVEATSADEAMSAAADGRLDLILLDQRLGIQSGLDLVTPLRAAQPAAELVIVTAYGTIESAVAAIRDGATDYLTKPFTPSRLEHMVVRARARMRQASQVDRLRDRLRDEVPDALLESDAPAMRSTLETLTTAAAHDVPVLLRGEHGTGKTLLARLLHERSRRCDGPFVVVNCPTLSEELLASELFGHVRGAFTGAVRTQSGKVEAAEGGTLFLDEIGEVSNALQAKLLRFVQERAFERVGEARTRTVDVRVVAATNRDLDADVAAGRFREDLLYRLNTVEVRVPPLRDRREDVARLAAMFAEFVARASGRPAPHLSPEVTALLTAYPWPGNVRELRNAVERAVIFTPGDVVEPAALPERLVGSRPGPWLGGDYTLSQIEETHIARVLERLPTQEAAARALGVDASTLWRRRRRQT